MTTPFGNHTIPITHISEQNYYQQQLVPIEPVTPKYASNPLVKSRSNKKREVIQPNPSKYKGPTKGLAYKEVKEKIIDKLAPINPLAFYTSNLDETYLEQLSKEEPQDFNQVMTPKNDKKRLDYKNMMKKIRKGITKTSSSVNNQQSYEHQQQQHQQNKNNQSQFKLSRSDRTTSAYMAYNNRHRLQTANNELMLNTIHSISDFNTVSMNRNKILEVKGDKISIDIILNEPTTLASLSRHKTSLIIRNKTLLDFGGSQNTISGATTLDTYNTQVYNLDRNYYRNTRLKSPENGSRLGLKSSFSSYSVTGKRINPTPDFDNSNNNSLAFANVNQKIF